MSQDPESEDGQLSKLGLLERLREGLRDYGAPGSDLYYRIDRLLQELAKTPTCTEIELTTAFQIELWHRYGKDHLRMVIAATSSIMTAHAAFDAAVKQYASERLTLGKGAMEPRDHQTGQAA
jgi:hypothetical protein